MIPPKSKKLTIEDIVEAVKMLEQFQLEERIREAVIICSPANKYKLRCAMPALFVVDSPFCEDDKCYMVTDKELAAQLRRVVRE